MFGPSQSFCLCCENYSEYLQAISLIDRLNTANNKYPIEYELVSGSDNSESLFEKRWLEITCEKPVRIKHFVDELEEEVKLIQMLNKQNPDLAPNAKSAELPFSKQKPSTSKKQDKKESLKQKDFQPSENSSLIDLIFEFEKNWIFKDKDENV